MDDLVAVVGERQIFLEVIEAGLANVKSQPGYSNTQERVLNALDALVKLIPEPK